MRHCGSGTVPKHLTEADAEYRIAPAIVAALRFAVT
jgi:hypothetical protein